MLFVESQRGARFALLLAVSLLAACAGKTPMMRVYISDRAARGSIAP